MLRNSDFHENPVGLDVLKCSTWCFSLIGDDAAHKMGLSAPQVCHQLVEILLKVRSNQGTHSCKSCCTAVFPHFTLLKAHAFNKYKGVVLLKTTLSSVFLDLP